MVGRAFLQMLEYLAKVVAYVYKTHLVTSMQSMQPYHYTASSVLYKHSAKWNLIMDYVGRLAGLIEEGPAPSKKTKTGRPQSHH